MRPPLPPILLSNFSWPYQYICLAWYYLYISGHTVFILHTSCMPLHDFMWFRLSAYFHLIGSHLKNVAVFQVTECWCRTKRLAHGGFHIFTKNMPARCLKLMSKRAEGPASTAIDVAEPPPSRQPPASRQSGRMYANADPITFRLGMHVCMCHQGDSKLSMPHTCICCLTHFP